MLPQAGSSTFGLAVDAVGDTQEIVVKSMPCFMKGLGDQTHAVPMALVSRLETFPAERLERLGRQLVQQDNARCGRPRA